MTPLQALVVSVLFERELSSRQIREELALRRVEKKMPLLYRMLGRAELAGYVCGRYCQYQTVDGRRIRERYYRVSKRGLREWKKVKAFYEGLEAPPEDFQAVSMKEWGE